MAETARAHGCPRYEWEPAEVRDWPVYRYPDEVWRDPPYTLGARHDDLRADLAAELDRLIGHEG
ncbi:hypothetical protein ACTMS0_13785 [Micromonospora sp. H33]|uniref:hypothetical protein n=1 Tax=Micromonospora sp. H33 TaxID=3452215 RepID=UPI003F892DD0